MAGECPKNLTVTVMENNQSRPTIRPMRPRSVIWFEEPAVDFAEASLAAAKKAVEAGATLVFAGKTMPLLALYAGHSARQAVAQRPDKVFEDFENGYDKWKVEGDAFGREPAKGTLPQPTTRHRIRRQGPGQLVRRRRQLDRQTHQPAVHDQAQLHPLSHRRRSRIPTRRFG